jgi:hypothetical protein
LIPLVACDDRSGEHYRERIAGDERIDAGDLEVEEAAA